jgi:hypothetical protein
LPSDAFSIFDNDPVTLWPDSISRLQAPKTISHWRFSNLFDLSRS